MYKSANHERLNTLVSELSELATVEISGFNKNIDELLVSVPEDQKKQVEGLKIMMHKVTALSKKGKSKEANELINKYKNGCKNNK